MWFYWLRPGLLKKFVLQLLTNPGWVYFCSTNFLQMYIYILCLGVTTAKPIGPNFFFVGPHDHVTTGKVYGWSNFQKFTSHKIWSFLQCFTMLKRRWARSALKVIHLIDFLYFCSGTHDIKIFLYLWQEVYEHHRLENITDICFMFGWVDISLIGRKETLYWNIDRSSSLCNI